MEGKSGMSELERASRKERHLLGQVHRINPMEPERQKNTLDTEGGAVIAAVTSTIITVG